MTTPDVPSSSQLLEAKGKLRLQQEDSRALAKRISDAQATLAQIIADSKQAIRLLEDEKQEVEADIECTKAFLSPMRRLPDDILRLLFLFEFEVAPCCAWALAAVCARWRRIVLGMPRMWSKMRLVTTPYSSPETIRLWLERSGSTVPLDIEIYLRVSNAAAATAAPNSTASRRIPGMVAYALPPLPPPVPWSPPQTAALLYPPPSPTSPYAVPLTPGLDVVMGTNAIAGPSGAANDGTNTTETPETLDNDVQGAASTSAAVGHGSSSYDAGPPITPFVFDAGQHTTNSPATSTSAAAYAGDTIPTLPFTNATSTALTRVRLRKRALMRDSAGGVSHGPPDSRTSPASWGHIALFYLVEQMHRWKRFVFRFEKSFESVSALRSIIRDAPMLEEFEVSCGEAPRAKDTSDWAWLPCSPAPLASSLSALKSVTLSNVPFTATSTLFTSAQTSQTRSLQHLTLRALVPNQPQHAYGAMAANAINNNESQLNIHRITQLISIHTALKSISLHFPAMHPPILPQMPFVFTLHELTSLSVSGAASLTTLLSSLKVPALESLSLALDRGPTAVQNNELPPPSLEEAVSTLLLRSATPAVKTLCVSFPSSTMYYNDFPAPGAPPPWSYFQHLPHVTTLKVVQGTLEPLLTALGVPGVPGVPGMNADDDLSDDGIMPPLGGALGGMGGMGGIGGGGGGAGGGVGGGPGGAWMLPELENLEIKNCFSNSTHTPYGAGHAGVMDGCVKKLVELVGARNPLAGGGAGAAGGVAGGMGGGLANPLPIPVPFNGAGGGAAGPTSRLKRLHVHECFSIGSDVHAWLRARVEDFSFVEPPFSSGSHRYVPSPPLGPGHPTTFYYAPPHHHDVDLLLEQQQNPFNHLNYLAAGGQNGGGGAAVFL